MVPMLRYQLSWAMNSTVLIKQIYPILLTRSSPQSKETALVMLADTCKARAELINRKMMRK